MRSPLFEWRQVDYCGHQLLSDRPSNLVQERYGLPLMIVENGIGLHEIEADKKEDGMI